MTIEEIWKDNAYRGLWGEVVEGDIYRLRQLKFVPDIIFDLGANVGTFSRFARELFPNATIIAVEPDPRNIAHFKQFNGDLLESNIMLFEEAIGVGEVYRDNKAVNGSHECYLSKVLGYEDMTEGTFIDKTEVRTTLLDSLTLLTVGTITGKYLIKIDIEGSETALFTHEPSKAIIRGADYIAMELHYFAMTPNGVLQVMDMTKEFLESLKETHDTEYVHPMFYATKKC